MNIRKIILEELDFDWVDSVPDITKGTCIKDHLHRQGSTYKVIGIKDGIVYLENSDTHRLRKIPKDVLMDRLELRAITICDSTS